MGDEILRHEDTGCSRLVLLLLIVQLERDPQGHVDLSDLDVCLAAGTPHGEEGREEVGGDTEVERDTDVVEVKD